MIGQKRPYSLDGFKLLWFFWKEKHNGETQVIALPVDIVSNSDPRQKYCFYELINFFQNCFQGVMTHQKD